MGKYLVKVNYEETKTEYVEVLPLLPLLALNKYLLAEQNHTWTLLNNYDKFFLYKYKLLTL